MFGFIRRLLAMTQILDDITALGPKMDKLESDQLKILSLIQTLATATATAPAPVDDSAARAAIDSLSKRLDAFAEVQENAIKAYAPASSASPSSTPASSGGTAPDSDAPVDGTQPDA
jgi:hypothetical protein